MSRRWYAGTAAMVLAAALTAGCAQMGVPQTSVTGKNRVIFQVSDGDAAKWNLALNNARNVQTDLGAANVDIEIVAYGPGIGMIQKGSPVTQRIDEATLSGMKVMACENTMHGHKLTRGDMLGGIGYVKAGVVEIMRRQQEGWSYIRP